jgi:hypothetical protein
MATYWCVMCKRWFQSVDEFQQHDGADEHAMAVYPALSEDQAPARHERRSHG